MQTYNFIVTIGSLSYNIDVNAMSEEEAIQTIEQSYPALEGWRYILLQK